jgi:hypothetical protein
MLQRTTLWSPRGHRIYYDLAKRAHVYFRVDLHGRVHRKRVAKNTLKSVDPKRPRGL